MRPTFLTTQLRGTGTLLYVDVVCDDCNQVIRTEQLRADLSGRRLIPADAGLDLVSIAAAHTCPMAAPVGDVARARAAADLDFFTQRDPGFRRELLAEFPRTERPS
jgi:hypothetical protein